MNTLIYSITPYRQNSLLEHFSDLVAANNRCENRMSIASFISELRFMRSEAPFPMEHLTWIHMEEDYYILVADNHNPQFRIDYKVNLHVPAFVENARKGIESGIVAHSITTTINRKYKPADGV